MAGILPWVQGLFNIGSEVFSRSRAGYETSPQKRAFLDSVRNEQRIFERDSAYQSPSAQMARFKEAGLNPNLIYGQGTPGNVSGQAMKAEAPSNRFDIMDGVMQAMTASKEMEYKDSQIANVQAQTKFIEEQTAGATWRAKRLQQDFDHLEQKYPWIVDELRTDVSQKDLDLFINQATKSDEIAKRKADSLAAYQHFSNLLKEGELLDSDGKIKAEVLGSKEKLNYILQKQVDFLKDGKFTMTQFWQAFMMFLSKSL